MTTRKIKSFLRQATVQHTVLPFLFDFLSAFFVTSAVFFFLLSSVPPGFFHIFSVLSSLFPASRYYPSQISFSFFFTFLFPRHFSSSHILIFSHLFNRVRQVNKHLIRRLMLRTLEAGECLSAFKCRAGTLPRRLSTFQISLKLLLFIRILHFFSEKLFQCSQCPANFLFILIQL